jgi:hypothetical protein
MPDQDVVDEPMSIGGKLQRVLVVTVIVVLLGFWVWIFSGGPRADHKDEVGDRAFVERTHRRCQIMRAELTLLPAATESETAEERADVVDSATAIVARMVDEIEADLPDDEEDLEVLEQWIADWRVYVGDRQSYADRLRADEGAQFEVTENERVFRGVDDTIRNFADVNDMPDCAVPGDVG